MRPGRRSPRWSAWRGVLWFAAELHPDFMSANGAVVTSGQWRLRAVRSRRAQPNCVIDGDTIRYGGIKIRLEDIDAPEVFSPKCASEATRGERRRSGCWS